MDDSIGLSDLNDDVLGVIMRVIVDKTILYAVAAASKRFYRIFTGVLVYALCIIPPERTYRYTNLVDKDYVAGIDRGLFNICDQLIQWCYVRDIYQIVDDRPIYAIYHVAYSKCDACGKYIDIIDRCNKFFRLRLGEIHDGIVDNINIDTKEICKPCRVIVCDNTEIAHANRTYYLHYIGGRTGDQIIRSQPDYRVRKLTFIAQQGLTIVNLNL